jgi:hypothetical protein
MLRGEHSVSYLALWRLLDPPLFREAGLEMGRDLLGRLLCSALNRTLAARLPVHLHPAVHDLWDSQAIGHWQMTATEEIDALEATGLPPMEFLVLLDSRARTTCH